MQKSQLNPARPFQLWVALLAAVALIIPGFAADAPDPRLVVLNERLADDLGLDPEDGRLETFLAFEAGARAVDPDVERHRHGAAAVDAADAFPRRQRHRTDHRGAARRRQPAALGRRRWYRCRIPECR